MVNSSGYQVIYRRMLATLLVLALTPLLLLGAFSLQHIDSIYNEKISAGLEAVTSSKCRALDTFLAERIAQIKTMAFTHSYEELTDASRLSQLFSVMQQSSPAFVDMGIIGMDGKHVAYVGPFDLDEANYQNTRWFQDVQFKGVICTDVFLGFRQTPHFIIAVLRHTEGKSFILRATIDMSLLESLLSREYSGLHSEAFLVNRQGILQTNSLFHGKILERFALPDFKHSTERIIITQLPSLETETKNLLQAAVMPLETMPWYLVVVDDVYETLHSLRKLQIWIVIGLCLGSFLIILGSLLCIRKLINYLQAADEQKLQMGARMLQASKMAALGKMAAGVAHEVNNPLMLIQENAGWIMDLLEDESPKDIKNYEEIEQSCAKIMEHVKRAKGITQRMLGFGRRMNPGRKEVLINALVKEACEMLKAEALNRNIKLVLDFEQTLPVIYSDPAQLEQVLINVIDNALDAIGQDGVVELKTYQLATGVGISISDNGPGMNEATRLRVFDPFFTTKKVGEGTGLGLAICFSILQKLGGHIAVKSTEGQGATFTITLPPEPPIVATDFTKKS